MYQLTDKEIEAIYSMAELIVGSCQADGHRRNIIITNIGKRISQLSLPDLQHYLAKVQKDPSEHEKLISFLTIHHTSWFREAPHFAKMEKSIVESGKKRITVGSFGCSTGEEVYSFALLLQSLRGRGFDYTIEGYDIDPVSVRTAAKGIYPLREKANIPEKYHKDIWIGSGETEGLFTLSKEVRSRCRFNTLNLVKGPYPLSKYDFIICRNVLIYFSQIQVEQIIGRFLGCLKPDGLLILGHSETVYSVKGLETSGNSVYIRSDTPKAGSQQSATKTKAAPAKAASAKAAPKTSMNRGTLKRKILVVDDSMVIRKLLQHFLVSHGYKVTLAESAEEASLKVAQEDFDLITLDINMPGQNGDEWLRDQRKNKMKTPTVIITDVNQKEASSTMDALGRKRTSNGRRKTHITAWIYR